MMAKIAQDERGGALVLSSAFIVAHRDAIIAIANRHRVPTVYGNVQFAQGGGLMAFGPDIGDAYRAAAEDADRPEGRQAW